MGHSEWIASAKLCLQSVRAEPEPLRPVYLQSKGEMEIVRLKIADLEPNAGQVEGLPINPRQWTMSDIDALAKSLKETPELFEARPVIVVPHEGKYVILGGNLRYEASRKNKAGDVPAVIFPEDTPIAKLKEIVIKDNGTFGAWDFDALANEWDDLPLTDWGVPAWETPEGDEIDRALAPKPDDFNYEQRFGVIVTCRDELEQQAVYERLTGEGLECKVVSV